MSSFLCFLCHSTVNSDTNEDTREKYKDVVGMPLSMDFHLCHICCHVLNKLWLFRAVCHKRSLEYPVLFSEKGTLNLQRNDLEIISLCSEENCGHYHTRNVNSKTYDFHYGNDSQDSRDGDRYVKLEEDLAFEDYYQQEDDIERNEPTQLDNYEETAFIEKDIYEDKINETVYEDKDYTVINDVQNTEVTDTDLLATNIPATLKEIDETSELNLPEDVNDEVDLKTESDFETEDKKEDYKRNKRKSKKMVFENITLSLEQQKAELERHRKEKKYIEAEFKCYNCALGFLFKDTYQTHMMRHEESNGEYRCGICTLRFASPAVLRAHTAGHKERHLCSECGSYVKPQSRGRHMRACWKKESGAACHLCARMFRDSNGLQQHLKRFHSRCSARAAACGVCAQPCDSPATLRTHMLKHITRKFPCGSCPSIFSSPYSLAQHQKKHRATETEDFYCEICNVSYQSKKSLLAHKRNAMNHQQTIFECPICSRSCPNQKSLASHMESVHSASRNYACPTCQRSYTNRKSLVRHVNAHTAKPEVKKAICHLCGAGFKGNNKLNRHLRQVCQKGKIADEFADLYNEVCNDQG